MDTRARGPYERLPDLRVVRETRRHGDRGRHLRRVETGTDSYHLATSPPPAPAPAPTPAPNSSG
ncbi:hypothetical protein LRS74_00690 [Streptomyces sp. LX-29]|uniref:hypothetical protein n=1 Tax=Streptomyces sp. LX-29 TaxID=2900152 RepID=UPI00240E2E01|nr:hypothetical protein [Streptomyces sp. LX-29]WFB05694.1 hypothetical protein LRS74_00690 [Streptomyces sp. LX-29]